MPHSISPETDNQNPTVEETMADAPTRTDESQDIDNDITMAETDALSVPVKEEDQKDVKLDELFADVDSDDEFPSSRPGENKFSSSPEAPASPM